MDEAGVPEARRLAIAAVASAAAAIVHSAAAGIHADHSELSRLFVALAIAQGGAAILGFLHPSRLAAIALIAVNGFAVIGWLVTRLVGISWIDGLEVAERPQLADSIGAALGLVAVVAAVATLSERMPSASPRAVMQASLIAGVLLVPALLNATTHEHSEHEHVETSTDSVPGTPDDGHDHDHADRPATDEPVLDEPVLDQPVLDPATAQGAASAAVGSTVPLATVPLEEAVAWPRAWDPTAPIDFGGVPGVTSEQQARAEQLAADTLRDLPQFADVDSLEALGYQSIGDSGTGFEHYINYQLFDDGKLLDPTAPESLVYQVDGGARTLVSAMFIAGRTAIDDPELLDFAGPLMQWHVHQDLCWGLDADGRPKVMSVLSGPDDTCPPGTVNTGGDNPMVHVWIAPHPCGPFAALEGHGAGQADPATDTRVDQCAHVHD